MPSLYVKAPNDFRGPGIRAASTDYAGVFDPPGAEEGSSTDVTLAKGDCVDLLARMVEGEIIPRLLLAHQAKAPPPARLSSGPAFGPDTIEQFAQMVLSNDTDTLLAFVSSLLGRGETIQSIYVDLLAPTARKLGHYWDTDYCSFADVTIGLGKLQSILHELSRYGAGGADDKRAGRSVLLAVAPGEQHTFGLLVIEEYFRRAGWRTWCEPRGTIDDLAQMVGGQWYDLFGLSVSCESNLDQVAATVTSVRRASKNRSIRVMVGGRLISERPDLAASVGADVTASDGDQAVALAEGAVLQLEGRC